MNTRLVACVESTRNRNTRFDGEEVVMEELKIWRKRCGFSKLFLAGLWFQIWCGFLVKQGLAELFHWSEISMEKQAQGLGCIPVNYYKATTLKQRSKGMNTTMIGKVADIEVCALLCCEMERCDTAWLEKSMCYSVTCDSHVCETEKATGNHSYSAVVQFKRRDQHSQTTKEASKADVTGVKYDENKSTIVTKQAVSSTNAKPDKHDTGAGRQGEGASDKKQEALVTISNQSPMEQLLQTESSIIHNKATVEETASKKTTQDETVNRGSEAAINKNIQSLSEHLKKVDEKTDMTAALEENDKRTIHPKLRYHKHHDLRHNLISPIIIGAFTCMAVIALSGFAMAIIKYQKERKERHMTQSTQTFD